jgi:hypothetical protein
MVKDGLAENNTNFSLKEVLFVEDNQHFCFIMQKQLAQASDNQMPP